MKKKILLVGPVPPPYGGIAKYVNDLYTSTFLKKRFKLLLFNTVIPENVRSFEKQNERSYLSFLSEGILPGIKLIFYVISTFITFGSYLAKEKPVIVHVFTSSFWGFWRNSIYIIIAKLFRIKIIFHLLNAIDIFWDESSGISRTLITFVLNNCNILLVQSDGIKNFVKGISKSPVQAIYNGVETWRYDRISTKKYYSNGNIQVMFLGKLSKNKGVFDIIQAASKIKEIDISYVFAGTGDVKLFEDYANKYGCRKLIRFTGEISDKEKDSLLLKSDIFILPSYAEGQPLSILEAMSAGLPVISSSIGSIPEIIENGINGYLIKPGDVSALAKCINLLSQDHGLIKFISENNYKIARKKYDIMRVFKEIEITYNKIQQIN